MNAVVIYTIGFTQKSAEQFFSLLEGHAVERLVDIRANNTSQLSGFTKKDDLSYFLRRMLNIDYHHLPSLAPTPDIRAALKNPQQGWPAYERMFRAMLEQDAAREHLDRSFFTEKT